MSESGLVIQLAVKGAHVSLFQPGLVVEFGIFEILEWN